VLAQLSANDVANVGSDFTSIGSGLKSLQVTDSKVQSGLNATSALVQLLIDSKVRSDIKKLITAAAQPVDQITLYLADQAQTTGNTYTQAIAVNNLYWGDLTQQRPEDQKFCAVANLCNPVYVLATRARDAGNADLTAKQAAAAAAVTAIQKIHNDNAVLVANVEHLDAKALVDTLKGDEPDLLTAIRNLRSL
jgi:hypothetical protein